MNFCCLRRVIRRIFKPSLGTLLSLALVFQSVPATAFENAERRTMNDELNSQGNFTLLDYYPPSHLAKVNDSYLSSPFLVHRSSFPLVINIQDLHAHPGVQKKISQLLEYYASKGIATQFVAVEGAQGIVDTTLMALFPDQEIKKQVSEHFMEEGILTGMEDYAIRNSKPEYLYGVDDQETYDIHKELFQKTLANRSKLATQIQDLQTKLQDLEPQVYSKAMKSLKQKSLAYEKGELPLKDYLKHLNKSASKANIPYPQELQRMEELLNAEGRTRNDELKLQKETKQFLTFLYPRLTKEESDKLARYTKQDNTVYYLYLNILARRHHALDQCPKHLKSFLAYTRGMDSLDMQKFQGELDNVVFKLHYAQARTSLQKNLVQAERDLALLESLVEHKLTEDDFKTILPRTKELLSLLETLLPNHESRTTIHELLAESIDFYALALLRDKPLVEQTLARLNDEGYLSSPFLVHRSSFPTVAVLVTGGFHSPGIARLLKERGISYLTISPHVDSYTPEDQKRYIELLAGKETTETTGDTHDYMTISRQPKLFKLFKPDTNTNTNTLAVAAWAIKQVRVKEMVMAVSMLLASLGSVKAVNAELEQAYKNAPQGVSVVEKPGGKKELLFWGNLADQHTEVSVLNTSKPASLESPLPPDQPADFSQRLRRRLSRPSDQERSHTSDPRLPDHWKTSWPVPTQEELEEMKAILKVFPNPAKSISLGGLVSVDESAPESMRQGARRIRALYYLFPEYISVLMMNWSGGYHELWTKLLIEKDEKNVPIVEDDLVGAAFNRGLSLIRQPSTTVQYGDNIFQLNISPNDFITGFLGVLGSLATGGPYEERILGIVKSVDDENLPHLLKAMDYYLTNRLRSDVPRRQAGLRFLKSALTNLGGLALWLLVPILFWALTFGSTWAGLDLGTGLLAMVGLPGLPEWIMKRRREDLLQRLERLQDALEERSRKLQVKFDSKTFDTVRALLIKGLAEHEDTAKSAWLFKAAQEFRKVWKRRFPKGQASDYQYGTIQQQFSGFSRAIEDASLTEDKRSKLLEVYDDMPKSFEPQKKLDQVLGRLYGPGVTGQKVRNKFRAFLEKGKLSDLIDSLPNPSRTYQALLHALAAEGSKNVSRWLTESPSPLVNYPRVKTNAWARLFHHFAMLVALRFLVPFIFMTVALSTWAGFDPDFGLLAMAVSFPQPQGGDDESESIDEDVFELVKMATDKDSDPKTKADAREALFAVARKLGDIRRNEWVYSPRIDASVEFAGTLSHILFDPTVSVARRRLAAEVLGEMGGPVGLQDLSVKPRGKSSKKEGKVGSRNRLSEYTYRILIEGLHKMRDNWPTTLANAFLLAAWASVSPSSDLLAAAFPIITIPKADVIPQEVKQKIAERSSEPKTILVYGVGTVWDWFVAEGYKAVKDLFPNVRLIGVDAADKYRNLEACQTRLQELRFKGLPFETVIHSDQAQINKNLATITWGEQVRGVDAVMVTTTPKWHWPIARQWLRRPSDGKKVKVYVEKPFAMPDELPAVVGLEESLKKNIFAVDFFVDSDAFRHVLRYRLLDKIGAISSVVGTEVEKVDTNRDPRAKTLMDPQESGGGIAYDVGGHLAALIEIGLNQKASTIQGSVIKDVQLGRYQGAPGADNVETYMKVDAQTPSGIPITLYAATGFEHHYEGVTFFGENGSLEIMVGTETHDPYAILRLTGKPAEVFSFREGSVGYASTWADFLLSLYGLEDRVGVSDVLRLTAALRSTGLIARAYDYAREHRVPMMTYELREPISGLNPPPAKIPNFIPATKKASGLEAIAGGPMVWFLMPILFSALALGSAWAGGSAHGAALAAIPMMPFFTDIKVLLEIAEEQKGVKRWRMRQNAVWSLGLFGLEPSATAETLRVIVQGLLQLLKNERNSNVRWTLQSYLKRLGLRQDISTALRQKILQEFHQSSESGPSDRLRNQSQKALKDLEAMATHGKAYGSFEELLEDLWQANQEGKTLFGIQDLRYYPWRYGILGIFFFLKDLQENAFKIPVKTKSSYVIETSPERVPAKINEILGEELYSSHHLRGELFFRTLEKLKAEAEFDPELTEYQGMEGMLKLAHAMEAEGFNVDLSELSTVIHGNKARQWQRLRALIHPQAPKTLGWRQLRLSYRQARLVARELARRPQYYDGLRGFLRMLSWFWSQGEMVSPGNVQRAFYGGRAQVLVKHFTGQDLPPEWRWRYFMAFPAIASLVQGSIRKSFGEKEIEEALEEPEIKRYLANQKREPERKTLKPQVVFDSEALEKAVFEGSTIPRTPPSEEMKEAVRKRLDDLTEREAQVIRERYGDKPKTLAEIGKKLKVTHTRVRQIEAKALRKLRRSPASHEQSLRPTVDSLLADYIKNPNAEMLKVRGLRTFGDFADKNEQELLELAEGNIWLLRAINSLLPQKLQKDFPSSPTPYKTRSPIMIVITGCYPFFILALVLCSIWAGAGSATGLLAMAIPLPEDSPVRELLQQQPLRGLSKRGADVLGACGIVRLSDLSRKMAAIKSGELKIGGFGLVNITELEERLEEWTGEVSPASSIRPFWAGPKDPWHRVFVYGLKSEPVLYLCYGRTLGRVLAGLGPVVRQQVLTRPYDFIADRGDIKPGVIVRVDGQALSDKDAELAYNAQVEVVLPQQKKQKKGTSLTNQLTPDTENEGEGETKKDTRLSLWWLILFPLAVLMLQAMGWGHGDGSLLAMAAGLPMTQKVKSSSASLEIQAIISNAREAKGLNQKKFAETFGFNLNLMARLETTDEDGKHTLPSEDLSRRLEKTLGLPGGALWEKVKPLWEDKSTPVAAPTPIPSQKDSLTLENAIGTLYYWLEEPNERERQKQLLPALEFLRKNGTHEHIGVVFKACQRVENWIRTGFLGEVKTAVYKTLATLLERCAAEFCNDAANLSLKGEILKFASHSGAATSPNMKNVAKILKGQGISVEPKKRARRGRFHFGGNDLISLLTLVAGWMVLLWGLLSGGVLAQDEKKAAQDADQLSASALTQELVRSVREEFSAVRVDSEDFRISPGQVPPLTTEDVEGFFGKPLDLPVKGSAWADKVESAEGLQDLLLLAKDILRDSSKVEPAKQSPERMEISYPPNIPPVIRSAVDALAGGIRQAQPLLDSAVDSVPKDQRARLLEMLDWPGKKESDGPKIIWGNRTLRWYDGMASFRQGELLEAGHVLFRILDEVLPMLQSGVKVDSRSKIQTPVGEVLIGTSGDDVYEADDLKDIVLLIDLGGKNVYKAPVATAQEKEIRIVVDGGDVTVKAENDRHGNAGSGIFGIGLFILPNKAGRKEFHTGSYSQGVGIGGIGGLFINGGAVHLDAKRYVQGLGSFGVGILSVRQADNSIYNAEQYGLGVGLTRGVGLFHHDGDNAEINGGMVNPDPREPLGTTSLCLGVGFGPRAYAGGGTGIAAVKSNKSRINTSYFGMGAGYWHAAGIARLRGNDNVVQARRYVYGSGVHYAFGHCEILGNRNRILNWGVTNFAWDNGGASFVLGGNRNQFYGDWGIGNSEVGNSLSFSLVRGNGNKLRRPGLGSTLLVRDLFGYAIHIMDGTDNEAQLSFGPVTLSEGPVRYMTSPWGVVRMKGVKLLESIDNLEPPVWRELPRTEVVQKEKEDLEKQISRAEGSAPLEKVSILADVAGSFSVDEATPKEALKRLLILPREEVRHLIDVLNPSAYDQMAHLLIISPAYGEILAQELEKQWEAVSPQKKGLFVALLRTTFPQKGIPLLLKALEGNLNSPVRSRALQALGWIFNRNAVDELGMRGILEAFSDYLSHPFDPSDQDKMLALLNKLRLRYADAFGLLSLATEFVPEDRARFLDAVKNDIFATVNHQSGPVLLDLLRKSKEENLKRVTEALASLKEWEPVVRQKLKTLLTSLDPLEQYNAVMAIGKLGHPEDVPLLESLLTHDRTQVREAAAISLARMGQAAGFERLITSGSSRVKELIMAAIPQASPEVALGVLEKGLTDSDPKVRRQAFASFRRISFPENLRLKKYRLMEKTLQSLEKETDHDLKLEREILRRDFEKMPKPVGANLLRIQAERSDGELFPVLLEDPSRDLVATFHDQAQPDRASSSRVTAPKANFILHPDFLILFVLALILCFAWAVSRAQLSGSLSILAMALPTPLPSSPASPEGNDFLEHAQVSTDTHIGDRATQEDRLIDKEMEIDGTVVGRLMAVADSSNGAAAADLVIGLIYKTFQDKLASTKNAIQAMGETFKFLKEQASSLTTFTTLSVVYVDYASALATVGVVGDSPVRIIDRDGQMYVSPEHNVRSNPEELRRALERGAEYKERSDTLGRKYGAITHAALNYGICLSRALGGKDLRNIVSREPEITPVPLGPESIILVASDGICSPETNDPIGKTQKAMELITAKGLDAKDLLMRQLDHIQGVIHREFLQTKRDNMAAIVWRASKPGGGKGLGKKLVGWILVPLLFWLGLGAPVPMVLASSLAAAPPPVTSPLLSVLEKGLLPPLPEPAEKPLGYQTSQVLQEIAQSQARQPEVLIRSVEEQLQEARGGWTRKAV